MTGGIQGIGPMGGSNNHRAQMTQRLQSLGIPEETIQQGPQAVQTYAEANGISLPQPPQRGGQSENSLMDRLNAIDSGQTTSSSDSGKAQFESQLLSLGIPADVISQGKSAVESYAQENGITLPQPPPPPSGSRGSQQGGLFNQFQSQ